MGALPARGGAAFPPSPPTRGCTEPQKQGGDFSHLYFGCRVTREEGNCGLGDTLRCRPPSLPAPCCSSFPFLELRALLEQRSRLRAGLSQQAGLLVAHFSQLRAHLGKEGRTEGQPRSGLVPRKGGREGCAVPWQRRAAGQRPGGSRWKRRTLSAPGAAPAAPGRPRAPPAPGIPAACGVGSASQRHRGAPEPLPSAPSALRASSACTQCSRWVCAGARRRLTSS